MWKTLSKLRKKRETQEDLLSTLIDRYLESDRVETGAFITKRTRIEGRIEEIKRELATYSESDHCSD